MAEGVRCVVGAAAGLDGTGVSPCRDGREDEDREDDEHMRLGAELLCALLREVENQDRPVPAMFRDWWEAHKRRDALREERGW